MQDDIRDYQRQLESQREAMITKRDDDVGQRDRLTQKNKLLVAALEENRVCTSAHLLDLPAMNGSTFSEINVKCSSTVLWVSVSFCLFPCLSMFCF